MSALFVLAAVPAAAQMPRSLGAPMAPNGALSDGITVVGSASLGLPATKATTTFRVSATKPFTLQEIKPLLDDISRADGAGKDAVLPPFSAWLGPLRTFAATAIVDRPTEPMLTAAIPIIAAAFAKSPGITLDDATVILTLADCSKYIDQARSQAILDAHHRADAIARDLGVRTGAVKAISATDQQQDRDGNCTAQFNLPGFGNEMQVSLADYVTVRLYERVVVRYAIANGTSH
jgi:hypothetical protein